MSELAEEPGQHLLLDMFFGICAVFILDFGESLSVERVNADSAQVAIEDTLATCHSSPLLEDVPLLAGAIEVERLASQTIYDPVSSHQESINLTWLSLRTAVHLCQVLLPS